MDLGSKLRRGGADPEICSEIESEVSDIFTACSFQDLTGQRTSKVINALRYIEQRVNAMIAIWGVEGVKPNTDIPDAFTDKRPDAHLLNGPALDGYGVSQSDVDALFADPPEPPAPPPKPVVAAPPPRTAPGTGGSAASARGTSGACQGGAQGREGCTQAQAAGCKAVRRNPLRHHHHPLRHQSWSWQHRRLSPSRRHHLPSATSASSSAASTGSRAGTRSGARPIRYRCPVRLMGGL